MIIDQFNSNYKSILNRIQGSDEGQINFVKFNLEKFANILDAFGKNIRDKSDEITDCAQMVSNETDIKIFIEHHRSDNPMYKKEKFQGYEDQ